MPVIRSINNDDNKRIMIRDIKSQNYKVTFQLSKVIWSVLSPGKPEIGPLQVWCHFKNIKNPTLSVDAYLPEEQSCWNSSWFDLKWWSLGPFLKSIAPTTIRRKQYE